MGYLSQRKSEKRTDVFLKILVIILYGLLFLSFWGDGSRFSYCLEVLQFHLYLVGILGFLFCIYKRFYAYSLILALFVIISFMNLGRFTQIIFNDSNENNQEVLVLYVNSVETSNYEKLFDTVEENNIDYTAINTWPNYNYKKDGEYFDVKNMIFTEHEIIKEGVIRLSPKYSSYFVVSKISGDEIVFVSVDYSGIKEEEAETVFNNLADFVNKQDNPVVVFGDFGVPAWTRLSKSFLAKTKLEVKNHIIPTNGKLRFNPFVIPTINVLAYKSIGLEDIKILPKQGNRKHPMIFKISF